MTNSAAEHSQISREFFAKASLASAEDDLLQASEKLWGASAHMVKSVAESRGWGHGEHREHFQVIDRLVEETGDREFRVHFNTANSLHSNFYENWLPRNWIEADSERIGEFLEKLEALAWPAAQQCPLPNRQTRVCNS